MRNPKNSAPMTLLDIIKNGYFQQVRFLVENGANLDQRDAERRTALMLCAFIEPEAWGVGLCRLLIENGATLYYRDKYGLNAFHYAVIYDRLELVRVYLKAIDFDLKDSDKLGNTALHYAVRAGNAVAVKLIAEAYVKYGIKFDKQNNDGFTPLQEARRLNKRRCVRILENTEILADPTQLESNIPLDLNGCDGDSASCRSSRKSISRPRSSFVSHRSSRSSLFTQSDYSFHGPPSSYSDGVTDRQARRRRRDQERVILPHEKNEKQLIRCASANDIRNNPEYLFHMTPIDAYPGDVPTSKKTGRIRSAFVRRSEVENDMMCRSTWRTEFRRLYMHYQFQCTPSYRETVYNNIPENESLPPLDKSMTPATSEHALDEVDKSKKARVKSGSISRQNTEEHLNALKNKSPQKQPARKMSQNVGHGGKMGSVDGSLESSSESINSSVSSKRQADGKVSKAGKDVAGRTSRNTNHAGHRPVPSVNVEEAK